MEVVEGCESLNAIVTIDHHFIKALDGKVWVKNIHDQEFWKRYTSTFDCVYVFCRMTYAKTEEDIKGYILSSSENIIFCGLPNFVGPKEMIKKRLLIEKSISKYMKQIKGETIAILRLPSTIGFIMYNRVVNKMSFGVEVVANPINAYSKKGSLIHYFVGKKYTHSLRKICMKADGVAYVTEYELQKYFPTMSITEHYSSIDLESSFYFKKSKEDIIEKKLKKIIILSRIDNEKKGHDTLIKALSKLKKSGLKIQCEVVGSGKLLTYYQELAKEKNLTSNEINFLGEVAIKKDVRAHLINADIFVYPSHSEGLPRVLIEAMACSLPIVASPVGGIPELIPEPFLVDYDDVDGYVEKIKSLLNDDELRYSTALQNFERAQKYEKKILNERRNAFYLKLISKSVKK